MLIKIERSCGGCTACCKTHSIDLLQKPAGTWCGHCEIGKGCKIYLGRPVDCRTFECAWLTGDGGGSNHRPDITNIVPEHRHIPGIGKTMWFWEVEAGALSSRLARNWTMRNLMVGNCVMHMPLQGVSRLYVPKNIDASSLHLSFKEKEVEIIQYVPGMF